MQTRWIWCWQQGFGTTPPLVNSRGFRDLVWWVSRRGGFSLQIIGGENPTGVSQWVFTSRGAVPPLAPGLFARRFVRRPARPGAWPASAAPRRRCSPAPPAGSAARGRGRRAGRRRLLGKRALFQQRLRKLLKK